MTRISECQKAAASPWQPFYPLFFRWLSPWRRSPRWLSPRRRSPWWPPRWTRWSRGTWRAGRTWRTRRTWRTTGWTPSPKAITAPHARPKNMEPPGRRTASSWPAAFRALFSHRSILFLLGYACRLYQVLR